MTSLRNTFDLILSSQLMPTNTVFRLADSISTFVFTNHMNNDNTTPTAYNTVSLPTDGVDLLPMHAWIVTCACTSIVLPHGIPVPNSQLMNN